jgi:predicted phosphate transport protein (TIGR00153 family)
MGANSIMKFFLPKDRIFYSLFEQVGETVNQMGKLLKQMVNETDYDKRSSILSQLENMEHKNDDHTHNIFTELGRNFITPFDREDIHYLASALDDIADYIFSSAKKINFYRVNPNDIGIQKMAELIEQATGEIKIAVHGLRDMKSLRQMTEAMVKINSLENQADDVYDLSIDRLFQTENDLKELIKKREIFHVMETVTDKCEDAANVIETIIVKYS